MHRYTMSGRMCRTGCRVYTMVYPGMQGGRHTRRGVYPPYSPRSIPGGVYTHHIPTMGSMPGTPTMGSMPGTPTMGSMPGTPTTLGIQRDTHHPRDTAGYPPPGLTLPDTAPGLTLLDTTPGYSPDAHTPPGYSPDAHTPPGLSTHGGTYQHPGYPHTEVPTNTRVYTSGIDLSPRIIPQGWISHTRGIPLGERLKPEGFP